MTYAQRELRRVAELEAAGLLNRVNYSAMTPAQKLAFNRGQARRQVVPA